VKTPQHLNTKPSNVFFDLTQRFLSDDRIIQRWVLAVLFYSTRVVATGSTLNFWLSGLDESFSLKSKKKTTTYIPNFHRHQPLEGFETIVEPLVGQANSFVLSGVSSPRLERHPCRGETEVCPWLVSNTGRSALVTSNTRDKRPSDSQYLTDRKRNCPEFILRGTLAREFKPLLSYYCHQETGLEIPDHACAMYDTSSRDGSPPHPATLSPTFISTVEPLVGQANYFVLAYLYQDWKGTLVEAKARCAPGV
jgi:hypothetical protein